MFRLPRRILTVLAVVLLCSFGLAPASADTDSRVTLTGHNDPAIDLLALQEAVDTYEVVRLRGTFDIGDNTVTITKTVTIRGQGPGKTVIKGFGVTSGKPAAGPPDPNQVPIFLVNGVEAAPKFRGIEFQGGAGAAILFLRAGGGVVRDSLISDVRVMKQGDPGEGWFPMAFGIWAGRVIECDASRFNPIDDCPQLGDIRGDYRIVGNEVVLPVYGEGAAVVPWVQDGIMFFSVPDIDSIIIRDNHVVNPLGIGIGVEGVTNGHAVVTGNMIDAFQGVFAGPDFLGDYDYWRMPGTVVVRSNEIDVSDVGIYESPIGVLLVFVEDSRAVSNTITVARDDAVGIDLFGSNRNAIVGNRIEGFGAHAIKLVESEDNRVTRNNTRNFEQVPSEG